MTLSAKRKELFYTELTKLADAGFGIREAARTMIESGVPAAERELLEQVDAALESGKSIGQAFREAGVSQLERVLVEAGEISGRPAPAFQHLTNYFGMVAEAKRQAWQAMIYPLVLLHLGLLLAAIPVRAGLDGLDVNLLATRFVVSLGVTYALIAGGCFLGRGLLKKAPRSEAVDRRLNALPFIGRARKSLALARFARVYHAALLAGLPMRETVRMAGEASQSGQLAAAAGRIEAAVREGGAVGPMLAAEPVFPKAFARSYATAEESGKLDEDMDRWAKHFAADSIERVSRLSVVLPKLGYALIVAFVVWKILAFYAGYYGAIEKELGWSADYEIGIASSHESAISR
ncbi:type II secretion system F family protein [Haloferula sargassicola]|uniref:Type II secretion system protein F n=1 Tax=Haloferula sargassicola TaxID=490096 RepID=A0ABP9UJ95_9BACT